MDLVSKVRQVSSFTSSAPAQPKSAGALTNSLRHRFHVGIIWNLVATVFNQGSTFLTNIVIANLLGRQRFGEYAIVLSTTQVVSSLAGLGMGYTATKYLAEFRSTNKERAGEILGFCSSVAVKTGALTAGAFLLLAPIIATNVLHAPELTNVLRLGAGVIFFAALAGYYTGALAGLEEYRILGIAGVMAGGLYLIVCVGAAFSLGLAGAVGGLLVSGMLQCLILHYLFSKARARHELVSTYKGLRRERRIIVKWVVPGLLHSLTALPALWLSQVFLTRQPGGFAELALYSAAYSLTVIVLFLPNVTQMVGMSLINNLRGIGDALEHRRVFWMNLRFTLMVGVIGACGIGLFGRLLLRAFGPSFTSALPTLLILLAATIPELLTYAANQVIQSNEKGWLAVFAVNLPRDLLILTAAYLLTPKYGAAGLALAYLGGRLTAFIVTLICVRRIGLGVPHRETAKTNLADVMQA